MENLVSTFGAIAWANLLVTKGLKWVLAQVGLTVTGTYTIILSWVTAILGAFVCKWVGVIPDANTVGVLILGVVSALGSNLTYEAVQK